MKIHCITNKTQYVYKVNTMFSMYINDKFNVAKWSAMVCMVMQKNLPGLKYLT